MRLASRSPMWITASAVTVTPTIGERVPVDSGSSLPTPSPASRTSDRAEQRRQVSRACDRHGAFFDISVGDSDQTDRGLRLHRRRRPTPGRTGTTTYGGGGTAVLGSANITQQATGRGSVAPCRAACSGDQRTSA